MTSARGAAHRGRGCGACVAACSALLVPAGVAEAAVKGGATITFPPAMTVGDTGKPAVLTLVNTNDGPEAARTNTVCNAGDGARRASPGERGHRARAGLQAAAREPVLAGGRRSGVFGVSATAAGRPGSNCAGSCSTSR